MIDTYTISDILTWLEDKTLKLNTEFQRRSVWPLAAKAYLIDTILRDRPMPKIYLRTRTDPSTRRSYREVVDGQQRLIAISEFADGEFVLGSRKEIFGEFAGMAYTDLDEETQRNFLAFQISAEQLFNASDELVLDIFQRLNAYGLDLTSQELRHGKYQGAFRNAVIDVSRRWAARLWDQFKILGVRARVRMADDELMAQMFGIVLGGVVDGGQPKINRLYHNYDGEIPHDVEAKVDQTLEYLTENFSDILETGLSGSPHFLMLFAAMAHALFGIPTGDIDNYRNDGINYMPPRNPLTLTDISTAKANLGQLADVLSKDAEEVEVRFKDFKVASAGTTQRIRSRRVRFLLLYKALLPEPI